MSPLDSDETGSAATPARRLPAVDIARGVAIAAMVVYHFAWDLSHFRFIEVNVVANTGWWLFARSIAASFLMLAGFSLVLAHGRSLKAGSFLRRLGMIVAAAAAISLATWYAFPETMIRFGILHHIALASVLGLAFLNAPLWLVALAAVGSAALPSLAASPAFDHPLLTWIGLSTDPPPSGDYVPLFPGFAAVLAGILLARLVLASPPVVERLARPRDEAVSRGVALAGRHSLAIYLVHQPLLFGMTFLAATLAALSSPQTGGVLSQTRSAFVGSCTSGCLENGGTEEACQALCSCAAERIDAAGLWDGLARSGGEGPVRDQVTQLVGECGAELFLPDNEDDPDQAGE